MRQNLAVQLRHEENAGGVGSTVAVEAVAAGRCRQRTARKVRGEEVVGRHIGAGGVVRRDIGRVGGDRDGCRQRHGLPTACPRIGEGRAGQLRAGCGPQVEKIRAGVAGATVKLQRGDLAGNRGRELHADFKRRAVIQSGQHRRIGRGEQAHRRGGCHHSDVEGLTGGEAAEIGGRDLDAERADISSPRRASSRDTCCGSVTITPPLSGRD